MKREKYAPRSIASFASSLILGWFDPLVMMGYKSVLTEKDLPNIPDCIDINKNTKLLQSYWDKQVKKNSVKKYVSLWNPLIKTFGFKFFVANFIGIFYFIGVVISPLVSFCIIMSHFFQKLYF